MIMGDSVRVNRSIQKYSPKCKRLQVRERTWLVYLTKAETKTLAVLPEDMACDFAAVANGYAACKHKFFLDFTFDMSIVSNGFLV
jgi:hypothetical protein